MNNATWNIKGLNFPIKQNEAKFLMRKNNISMDFLETRVIECNASKIKEFIF